MATPTSVLYDSHLENIRAVRAWLQDELARNGGAEVGWHSLTAPPYDKLGFYNQNGNPVLNIGSCTDGNGNTHGVFINGEGLIFVLSTDTDIWKRREARIIAPFQILLARFPQPRIPWNGECLAFALLNIHQWALHCNDSSIASRLPKPCTADLMRALDHLLKFGGPAPSSTGNGRTDPGNSMDRGGKSRGNTDQAQQPQPLVGSAEHHHRDVGPSTPPHDQHTHHDDDHMKGSGGTHCEARPVESMDTGMKQIYEPGDTGSGACTEVRTPPRRPPTSSTEPTYDDCEEANLEEHAYDDTPMHERTTSAGDEHASAEDTHTPNDTPHEATKRKPQRKTGHIGPIKVYGRDLGSLTQETCMETELKPLDTLPPRNQNMFKTCHMSRRLPTAVVVGKYKVDCYRPYRAGCEVVALRRATDNDIKAPPIDFYALPSDQMLNESIHHVPWEDFEDKIIKLHHEFEKAINAPELKALVKYYLMDKAEQAGRGFEEHRIPVNKTFIKNIGHICRRIRGFPELAKAGFIVTTRRASTDYGNNDRDEQMDVDKDFHQEGYVEFDSDDDFLDDDEESVIKSVNDSNAHSIADSDIDEPETNPAKRQLSQVSTSANDSPAKKHHKVKTGQGPFADYEFGFADEEFTFADLGKADSDSIPNPFTSVSGQYTIKQEHNGTGSLQDISYQRTVTDNSPTTALINVGGRPRSAGPEHPAQIDENRMLLDHPSTIKESGESLHSHYREQPIEQDSVTIPGYLYSPPSPHMSHESNAELIAHDEQAPGIIGRDTIYDADYMSSRFRRISIPNDMSNQAPLPVHTQGASTITVFQDSDHHHTSPNVPPDISLNAAARPPLNLPVNAPSRPPRPLRPLYIHPPIMNPSATRPIFPADIDANTRKPFYGIRDAPSAELRAIHRTIDSIRAGTITLSEIPPDQIAHIKKLMREYHDRAVAYKKQVADDEKLVENWDNIMREQDSEYALWKRNVGWKENVGRRLEDRITRGGRR